MPRSTEEVLKLKEEQRKRDWDAAYERIGQKPPKMEEVACASARRVAR